MSEKTKNYKYVAEGKMPNEARIDLEDGAVDLYVDDELILTIGTNGQLFRWSLYKGFDGVELDDENKIKLEN